MCRSSSSEMLPGYAQPGRASLLHGFAAADLLIKRGRLCGRVDAELGAERLYADPVLTQRQVQLALAAVAAHKAAVRVLLARVALDDALAQGRAGAYRPWLK